MLQKNISWFTCIHYLHILTVEHQMTQTSGGQESVNALYLFEIMLRSRYVIYLIHSTATEETFAYLFIYKHWDNFTVLHQFKAAIKHH